MLEETDSPRRTSIRLPPKRIRKHEFKNVAKPPTAARPDIIVLYKDVENKVRKEQNNLTFVDTPRRSGHFSYP